MKKILMLILLMSVVGEMMAQENPIDDVTLGKHILSAWNLTEDYVFVEVE